MSDTSFLSFIVLGLPEKCSFFTFFKDRYGIEIFIPMSLRIWIKFTKEKQFEFFLCLENYSLCGKHIWLLLWPAVCEQFSSGYEWNKFKIDAVAKVKFCWRCRNLRSKIECSRWTLKRYECIVHSQTAVQFILDLMPLLKDIDLSRQSVMSKKNVDSIRTFQMESAVVISSRFLCRNFDRLIINRMYTRNN